MTRARLLESRGNVFTPFTGCAHTTRGGISVRPSGSKFHLHVLLRRALSALRQPKGEKVSKLPYAIPLRKLRLLPLSEALLRFVNICVQTKAKVRLLSAHKVYECAPLLYRQNVGAAYG